jgi:hypothetical protein
VTLVASHHSELKEGFEPASPQIVKKVNRTVASKATQEVYSCESQVWTVNLLNRQRQEFDSIY